MPMFLSRFFLLYGIFCPVWLNFSFNQNFYDPRKFKFCLLFSERAPSESSLFRSFLSPFPSSSVFLLTALLAAAYTHRVLLKGRYQSM